MDHSGGYSQASSSFTSQVPLRSPPTSLQGAEKAPSPPGGRLVHPKDKVVRSAVACTLCRKAKMKCEGVAPCTRCLNAGVECVFEATSTAQAAPAPTSSSSGGSRSRGGITQAAFDARIAQFEDRLHRLESTSPTSTSSSDLHSPTSHSQSTHTAALEARIAQLEATVYALQLAAANNASTSSDSSTTSSSPKTLPVANPHPQQQLPYLAQPIALYAHQQQQQQLNHTPFDFGDSISAIRSGLTHPVPYPQPLQTQQPLYHPLHQPHPLMQPQPPHSYYTSAPPGIEPLQPMMDPSFASFYPTPDIDLYSPVLHHSPAERKFGSGPTTNGGGYGGQEGQGQQWGYAATEQQQMGSGKGLKRERIEGE